MTLDIERPFVYNLDMNGRFYVTTSDPRRRSTWQRVFGSDRLPVLAPRARFQALPGGSGETPAYDLDLRALLPAQRTRFAGYVARRYGIDYVTALAEVTGSTAWPIRDGPDVAVVQPEEASSPPPAASIFAWVRAKLAGLYVLGAG